MALSYAVSGWRSQSVPFYSKCLAQNLSVSRAEVKPAETSFLAYQPRKCGSNGNGFFLPLRAACGF
ncbi:MAG: hypothetical protein P8I95_05115 [Alphaproteobacteria bacterium]|nr:hypothetical protein [Alphaproteobacteria bacterium]